MVFIYYDNADTLKMQLKCWNSYRGVLKDPPRVLLVDDGSPKHPAAEIVKQVGCAIPITVFRITKDIPWNIPGARNLGCLNAPEWIYMSDMDMLLPAEDARRLFEEYPLEVNYCYWPNRVRLNGALYPRSSVHILFHRSKYDEAGGYDEDYSGYYGKEHMDFIEKLGRRVKVVLRDDVLVRIALWKAVRDAQEKGLKKDSARNQALYEEKKRQGQPKAINPLRFKWEKVLSLS